MYNTPTFPGIAIYGHSDPKMDITIGFTLKNWSRTCTTIIVEFTSKNNAR